MRQRHDLDKFGILSGDANGSGHITATYGLASLYYDVPVDWVVKPFVGAGIGYARIDTHNITHDQTATVLNDNDNVLIYSLNVGMAYPFNGQFDLVLGYQYLGAKDQDFTSDFPSDIDQEYSAHNVNLGVRLNF